MSYSIKTNIIRKYNYFYVDLGFFIIEEDFINNFIILYNMFQFFE